MPYSKLSDVPSQLKSVAPSNGTKRIKLTLSQANDLASMFDTIKARGGDVENPIAVAISSFRKKYTVKNGKWVLRKNEGTQFNRSVQMPRKALKEIFTSIPGSLETHMDKLRSEVRKNPPSGLGTIQDEFDLGIEGFVPSSEVTGGTLYVVNYSDRQENGNPKYFAVDVEFENGEVELSDAKEVKFDIVITAKNEQMKLEKQINESLKQVPFSDLHEATIELVEAGKKGKMKRARVKVAQKAETKNGNNRFYPREVLERAVTEAKESLPLLMDSQHRIDENGNSVTDLTKTCSIIHEIEIDDNGEVSLSDIEFLENEDGQIIHTLLEKGVNLQVSQRGFGTSHIDEDKDGNPIEIIDYVTFKGFDFVPPNEASVKEARVELEEKRKEKEGETKLENNRPELFTKKEDDNMPREKEKEKPKEEIKKPLEENQNQLDIQGLIGNPEFAKAISDIANKSKPDLTEEWDKLNKQFNISQSQLNDFLLKQNKAEFTESANTVIDSMLTDESYKRFNDSQKNLIKKNINLDSAFKLVEDISDTERIKKVVQPLLSKEIERMDSIIATTKLESTGYDLSLTDGIANKQQGIQHVKVLHESLPGTEYRAKLTKAIEDELKTRLQKDYWYMPENHPNYRTLFEGRNEFDELSIFERFLKSPMAGLSGVTMGQRLLLEANEEVTATDIGGRIATIAAVVIPIAWRLTTAFQVVSTGTQSSIIGDHKIAAWNATNSPLTITNDIADVWSTVETGEGGTIPVRGIQYTNFPVFATMQTMKTFITPHAIAIAKNTPMQPLIDTLAGLALDMRNVIDWMLWELQITKALELNATEVTSFETLTSVSGNSPSVAGDEFQAANQGWVRYEWVKSTDANGNPTTALFDKLYPDVGSATTTPSGSLTAVAVREAGGDNTVLNFGDDYTINWPDGSITLTATGATKENGNGIAATYTYNTSNAVFWSAVPDVGVSMFDHLINLRRAVGRARVLISDRNYVANFVGFNSDTEDLVTSGPQFTNAGGNPSDLLSRMNEVMNYAGLNPVKSPIIPQAWIPVGVNGAAIHSVQTPWSIKGPVTDEATNNDHYIAHQFSGSDVPKREKLALVGITDLASAS